MPFYNDTESFIGWPLFYSMLITLIPISFHGISSVRWKFPCHAFEIKVKINDRLIINCAIFNWKRTDRITVNEFSSPMINREKYIPFSISQSTVLDKQNNSIKGITRKQLPANRHIYSFVFKSWKFINSKGPKFSEK